MSERKTYRRRKFDFDIGYLIKSPCRGCVLHYHFPKCMDSCRTLDRIQTHIAQGISSCRTYSPLEDFSVQLESWRSK
jgi:hypothetical protein